MNISVCYFWKLIADGVGFAKMQPLVPAVTAEDGQWIITKPFSLLCKPGGHGVIWKLAYDNGVFQWFYDHGRKGVTVRQVRLV